MSEAERPAPARGRRPAWTEFRRALEEAGFHPSRARGQHFLLDSNCARSIARDAGVGPGERVLEVGPGCGFLTVHLAELGVELVAFEIDARLLAIARTFLAPYPNVRWVEADVLEGKHRLAEPFLAEVPPARPWKVVSNLPYSITGPLLVGLAQLANPPASMTLLLQREVAERLTARPGRRAWGALTARLALHYRAKKLRDVGPQVFWPRPRVESAVVRLELSRPADLGPGDAAGYGRLVGALFQHRRKTLRSSLRGLADPDGVADALERAGVEPTARPEELGPRRLLALSRALPPPPGSAHG